MKIMEARGKMEEAIKKKMEEIKERSRESHRFLVERENAWKGRFYDSMLREKAIKELAIDDRGDSVAIQFAEILEKNAKHVRSTEDEILLLIKIDGFQSTFEGLVEAIVINCKDEHLLDQDVDVCFE